MTGYNILLVFLVYYMFFLLNYFLSLDCGCHQTGSVDMQCDFESGQCLCEEGAYGIKCDACQVSVILIAQSIS